MKTYLINLDRDKERLAAASRQLDAFGVEFERISAVYGKDLSELEQSAAYNHFRWWCAVGRPIRPGEIGCAHSHYRIYRKILEDAVDIACILEDDVVLAPGFCQRVEEVASSADVKRAQVFLLSNHTNGRETGFGICRSQGDRHTEGYILTLKAAQALFSANQPMETPCDFWDRWARRGIIELYHAFPSVCAPNERDFVSGIAPDGVFDVRRLSFPRLAIHKFKRIIGKALNWIIERTERVG